MIQPQYLWQIGFVGAGAGTVTGCLYNAAGQSKRYSVTISTTAATLRALITPTVWDAINPVGMTILTVVTNDLYMNTGANYDGTWYEAPTSADEKVAVASYASDPISVSAVSAFPL